MKLEQKVTIWGVVDIDDTVPEKELINFLDNGGDIEGIFQNEWDDGDYKRNDNSESGLAVIHNQMHPTLVLKDDNDDILWTNGTEFPQILKWKDMAIGNYVCFAPTFCGQYTISYLASANRYVAMCSWDFTWQESSEDLYILQQTCNMSWIGLLNRSINYVE